MHCIVLYCIVLYCIVLYCIGHCFEFTNICKGRIQDVPAGVCVGGGRASNFCYTCAPEMWALYIAAGAPLRGGAGIWEHAPPEAFAL